MLPQLPLNNIVINSVEESKLPEFYVLERIRSIFFKFDEDEVASGNHF